MCSLRIAGQIVDFFHELIVDANRIVGVLAGNRGIGFAVDIAVIAHLGQGDHLVLFERFPLDEAFDLRMVDIQTDHFSCTPGRAAGFDGAGIAIQTSEEAHQA